MTDPSHTTARSSRSRKAVAADVDASSLRRVAKEIGLTPSGLRGFIDGATPYTTTLWSQASRH